MTPRDLRRLRVAPPATAPDNLPDDLPDDLSVDRLEVATPSAPVARRPLAAARILVVGANYSPEPSGIGPRTAAMARRLAATAGLVTVYTGVPHHPEGHLSTVYRGQRRHLTTDGDVMVLRHRHPTPRSTGPLGVLRYELGFLRAVTRTPPVDAPHVVMGVLPSAGGAVAAARIARSQGARLLLVVQALTPTGRRGRGPVAAFRRGLERIALREADEVAVVHEALRPHLIAAGVDHDRVHLVPNPDLAVGSVLDVAAARATLGWPRDASIVLRTGKIASSAEGDLLLRVARLLAGRGSPARLVLAGEGRELERLRRASEGLASIGFVTPRGAAQYPTVLAAADVLLLADPPGRADPAVAGRFSAYLAAGRPVVAALRPESPVQADVAAAVQAGAVEAVPAGDLPALVTALAALAADGPRRAGMGVAALAVRRAGLDRTTAGERIDRLVESMLWNPAVVPMPRSAGSADPPAPPAPSHSE